MTFEKSTTGTAARRDRYGKGESGLCRRNVSWFRSVITIRGTAMITMNSSILLSLAFLLTS